jgi:starch synthase (maltosyl-transferring)
LALDLLEGVQIIEAAARRATGKAQDRLESLLEDLGREADPRRALVLASDQDLRALITDAAERADLVRREPVLELTVDRERALYSTWYELFPRSQAPVPGRHGTLREAEHRLPELRDLGFDVVYLPPVHPLGTAFKKGKNNALTPGPDDPGSPWAIGGPAGGHAAVEPRLGTIEDFDHFVATANRLGLDVALDFAIQASPDHPWVRKHPQWFRHRPDGTIKYAENPPKKYQDVYPVHFENSDWKALWEALHDVLAFWIAHGVTIFRVDNPHTKPLPFWQWVIERIHESHPEVIFLSEAFTRPKMMKALAKVGFTQSYTYFTWRNTALELTEYLTELTSPEMLACYRPNFFTNTPDILPEILQTGGRPAFRQRLILAATLSPSYGIYSGFELCENTPVPGTEEYFNSEKYELKHRDFDAPGNIKADIARVNEIRRTHPALQRLDGLRFYETDNPNLLLYRKASADGEDQLIVVVNVDPLHPHHGTGFVPLEDLGFLEGASFEVEDLLTGATWTWTDRNYIRLDPEIEPAHILKVGRMIRESRARNVKADA